MDLPIVVALIVVLVLMALPIVSRRVHGHVNYINPFDLKQRLDVKDEIVILDLRAASDFERAHIAGAINVEPRQLAAGLKGPPVGVDVEEGRPVVLVCQSDLESIRAAKVLERQGRTGVMVMKGGMFRWKREHLPLVQGT